MSARMWLLLSIAICFYGSPCLAQRGMLGSRGGFGHAPAMNHFGAGRAVRSPGGYRPFVHMFYGYRRDVPGPMPFRGSYWERLHFNGRNAIPSRSFVPRPPARSFNSDTTRPWAPHSESSAPVLREQLTQVPHSMESEATPGQRALKVVPRPPSSVSAGISSLGSRPASQFQRMSRFVPRPPLASGGDGANSRVLNRQASAAPTSRGLFSSRLSSSSQALNTRFNFQPLLAPRQLFFSSFFLNSFLFPQPFFFSPFFPSPFFFQQSFFLSPFVASPFFFEPPFFFSFFSSRPFFFQPRFFFSLSLSNPFLFPQPPFVSPFFSSPFLFGEPFLFSPAPISPFRFRRPLRLHFPS